ncbi:hypothetical protein Plhal304r1_c023g0080091 [Plasmopara halstedii]
MKLSVTFPFVAVTVTSSCATASVIDDHHENALVFIAIHYRVLTHYAMMTTLLCAVSTTKLTRTRPCRDRIVDKQQVHLSASAISSNEKTPLNRVHTHSANEERSLSIHPESAIHESSEMDRLKKLIKLNYNVEQLQIAHVDSVDYLKALDKLSNTWYRTLTRRFNSLLKRLKTRSPNTVDKSANERTGDTQKILKRLPPSKRA